MRNDLTDITVVMDRSGSMVSCQQDMEGGLNTFIEEQKKQPGAALFTLVQFDTTYEFVHKGMPIRDVPKCRLVPRGGTALLDAIGQAVQETGERLNAIPEDQRPGLVVFVIITDGQENSSREWTLEKVKSLITQQQDAYKWQFTFLGANQDAFAAAGGMGIPSAANYTPSTSKQAFAGAHQNVTRMRAASSSGSLVSNKYTDEEVKAMAGK